MPLNSPADKQCNKIDSPAIKGVLYIVSTPLGNLEDITIRAINTLKSVDMIAAEDTRHTKKLLSHYGINTRLISCHEHNENERSSLFITKLNGGSSIALVTDAGTPSISDPGFRLVRNVLDEGISIVPVPGVSAAITALCVSGLSTDSFVFIGFLPRKKRRRIDHLTELIDEKKTLIFYESPRRVFDCLEEIREIFGDRKAVLCREMTKIHEEFIRGNISEILQTLSMREQVKGECTLVISGAETKKMSLGTLDDEIREKILLRNISASALAKELSVKYDISKNEIYNKILNIKNK